MSVRLDSRRLLSFAGPLAMGVNAVLWVSVLWLGFALVYLPFEAAYDALYISGQSVGFGDIVAESAALRAISAVRRAAPELVAYGDDGLDDLNRFLARSQAVTSAFAREHRQRETPIVG